MWRNKNKTEQQDSPMIELVDEKIKDVLSVQVLFSYIKIGFIDLRITILPFIKTFLAFLILF